MEFSYKVAVVIVATVIVIWLANALMPSMLSSISTMNRTVTGYQINTTVGNVSTITQVKGVPNGSGLTALLYLIPFVLVIGIVAALIVIYLRNK